jgi:D-aminopeptidase
LTAYARLHISRVQRPAGGAEPAPGGTGRRMSARRRVLQAVYGRADFNALRLRLPRAERRSIEAAPLGHIGLAVQIVSGEDSALVTVREHVPATTDVGVELARLEAKARERLT